MKMDSQVRSRLEDVQASLEHVISETNGLVTQNMTPPERRGHVTSLGRIAPATSPAGTGLSQPPIPHTQ